MIATSTCPRRSTPAADSRRLEALRQETQAVLDREIAFIPNSVFRKIEDETGSNLPVEDTAPSGTDSLDTPSSRMPAHLEKLCSAPLLSAAEERQLFCEMNYLKYRANVLRTSLQIARPNPRRLREIETLLEHATVLRNRIVHANVRLVMSIVKQFSDSRNRFDDLLSEGLNCLIKAVDKFDFDRGFRFSTYATRAVRREVFRLVQRQHRDRARYATGAQEALIKQLQPSTGPDGVELTWQRVDDSIQRLLGVLDERERFIISARYGFNDLGEKPTFQRLGQHLGVSKERVRQIEQRAMNKLRESAVDLQLDSTCD